MLIYKRTPLLVAIAVLLIVPTIQVKKRQPEAEAGKCICGRRRSQHIRVKTEFDEFRRQDMNRPYGELMSRIDSYNEIMKEAFGGRDVAPLIEMLDQRSLNMGWNKKQKAVYGRFRMTGRIINLPTYIKSLLKIEVFKDIRYGSPKYSINIIHEFTNGEKVSGKLKIHKWEVRRSHSHFMTDQFETDVCMQFWGAMRSILKLMNVPIDFYLFNFSKSLHKADDIRKQLKKWVITNEQRALGHKFIIFDELRDSSLLTIMRTPIYFDYNKCDLFDGYQKGSIYMTATYDDDRQSKGNTSYNNIIKNIIRTNIGKLDEQKNALIKKHPEILKAAPAPKKNQPTSPPPINKTTPNKIQSPKDKPKTPIKPKPDPKKKPPAEPKKPAPVVTKPQQNKKPDSSPIKKRISMKDPVPKFTPMKKNEVSKVINKPPPAKIVVETPVKDDDDEDDGDEDDDEDDDSPKKFNQMGGDVPGGDDSIDEEEEEEEEEEENQDEKIIIESIPKDLTTEEIVENVITVDDDNYFQESIVIKHTPHQSQPIEMVFEIEDREIFLPTITEIKVEPMTIVPTKSVVLDEFDMEQLTTVYENNIQQTEIEIIVEKIQSAYQPEHHTSIIEVIHTVDVIEIDNGRKKSIGDLPPNLLPKVPPTTIKDGDQFMEDLHKNHEIKITGGGIMVDKTEVCDLIIEILKLSEGTNFVKQTDVCPYISIAHLKIFVDLLIKHLIIVEGYINFEIYITKAKALAEPKEAIHDFIVSHETQFRLQGSKLIMKAGTDEIMIDLGEDMEAITVKSIAKVFRDRAFKAAVNAAAGAEDIRKFGPNHQASTGNFKPFNIFDENGSIDINFDELELLNGMAHQYNIFNKDLDVVTSGEFRSAAQKYAKENCPAKDLKNKDCYSYGEITITRDMTLKYNKGLKPFAKDYLKKYQRSLSGTSYTMRLDLLDVAFKKRGELAPKVTEAINKAKKLADLPEDTFGYQIEVKRVL